MDAIAALYCHKSEKKSELRNLKKLTPLPIVIGELERLKEQLAKKVSGVGKLYTILLGNASRKIIMGSREWSVQSLIWS